jgi:hypothetical protein
MILPWILIRVVAVENIGVFCIFAPTSYATLLRIGIAHCRLSIVKQRQTSIKTAFANN